MQDVEVREQRGDDARAALAPEGGGHCQPFDRLLVGVQRRDRQRRRDRVQSVVVDVQDLIDPVIAAERVVLERDLVAERRKAPDDQRDDEKGKHARNATTAA